MQSLASEAQVRPASQQTRLLGRRAEREVLDTLLRDASSGTSRVMVLRGDPGAGKSALLDDVGRHVAGWRVLSAVGVESELEWPYAGLHQVCGPVLDHLPRLPAPQRDALAIVFGRRAGVAPDRFLVGLATLSLLSEAAERGPLLCLIDDGQWIDQASAQILGFVARRLLAERIALVCAARKGSGDEFLAGSAALEIGGLSESDARDLLRSSLPGPLDSAVCEQLIVECRGNPLALLELPRTWDATALAGGFGLPAARPVAGKVEQSYLRRLARLPADTQLLVLTAAAEPLGDPLLLYSATRNLGVEPAAADAAADAGLLHIGGRVEFPHPLMRSATYRAATSGDRLRVHQALAEATDAHLDPDRRAWHLSRAASSPDEAVAEALVDSANRAQSRGGLAAMAAFLTRASELTPSPATRAFRALDAAQANVQAGSFDRARSLLAVAEGEPADDPQQARIQLVRAQLAFASSAGNEATPLLLAAGSRLVSQQPALARRTYLDAFSAAQFAGRLHSGIGTSDVARAARATARPATAEDSTGALLLDAFCALTEDNEAAVPLGRAALHELRADRPAARKPLRWLWHGCVLALELWDDESAWLLSERHDQLSRTLGALGELPFALGSRTPILVLSGNLSAAAALVDEASWKAEVAGVGSAPYGALTLAVWQGQEAAATKLIETTARDAEERREGLGVALCAYAKAVLCNASGQYHDALEAARRACTDPPEIVVHNWVLPELIESATRTGETALAAAALEELSRRTRASGTHWALGMLARSRALMENGSAEQRFQEAIARLRLSKVRTELARAHLLYGEWLRRANRRADARRELQTAYDMFSAMGVGGFAERAGRELATTGSTLRKRSPAARNELTAQEAQIARLARDGLSNPEISARLFISARTVEWHLRKVFSKLGISSRRQLRGLILP